MSVAGIVTIRKKLDKENSRKPVTMSKYRKMKSVTIIDIIF